MAVGIRRADYVKPLYQQNLALTSRTSCGRSVCIVRSRTQASGFFIGHFVKDLCITEEQTLLTPEVVKYVRSEAFTLVVGCKVCRS
jgi:hypothetical protein